MKIVEFIGKLIHGLYMVLLLHFMKLLIQVALSETLSFVVYG